MLIMVLKKYLLLSMFKTILMLNIFQDSLTNRNFEKQIFGNIINNFTRIFVQFNRPLLNKISLTLNFQTAVYK